MGNKGQFQLGHEKSGGRRPGSQNRVTKAMKEILREAFEAAGGKSYLVEMARKEPRAFMALLARLIPNEIHAELEGNIPTVIVRDYTGLSAEQKAMLGQGVPS